MIEVKISFSTPDELVAFFTKSQAQAQLKQGELPLSMAQAEETVRRSQNLAVYGTTHPEATATREEQALPEEPALKPKKAARGKKETSSTQAESGANNLGSVETDTLIGNAPLSADPAVNQPEAEAVDAADDAPVADVKFSIDDAREALKRLNDEQGIDAVRSLLSRMGANRISELPDAKYGELIAACPAA